MSEAYDASDIRPMVPRITMITMVPRKPWLYEVVRGCTSVLRVDPV